MAKTEKEYVFCSQGFEGAAESINDQESSSKRVRVLYSNLDDQEGDADSGDRVSPLGLTLKKTPSFLSLLQSRLFSGRPAAQDNPSSQHDKPGNKRDELGPLSMSEKLKASNFPATIIRIGGWQRTTRHEGDLTAKMYYAKRKLVWEVLDGALKSKIEMQWSDIIAIRAITRDKEPGTLEIELNQPPSFYREMNPQPRKHTLWQQASDFTGGQAPIWRRHYVAFPPGILDRHYEKLLLCDERLFNLSQKPFPVNGSPYFDPTLFGLSEHSLRFNGYGPSANYVPRIQQYHHQAYPTAPRRAPVRLAQGYPTLPSTTSIQVTELPFRHEVSSNNQFVTPTQIAWENIVSNNNNNNRGPFNISSAVAPNRAYHSQNYQPNPGLINDIESHLLGESHQVAPEPMNVNVNYNANWSGTNNDYNGAGADQVVQYGRFTNPALDGVYSEPLNWTNLQQSNDYTLNNSLPPFQFQHHPNGDSFFNSKQ